MSLSFCFVLLCHCRFVLFYLVKQRVLERSRHKLILGDKRELKLIVTEPETALGAKEKEPLKEKLSPTKVSRNCKTNQKSFEIVVRGSN